MAESREASKVMTQRTTTTIVISGGSIINFNNCSIESLQVSTDGTRSREKAYGVLRQDLRACLSQTPEIKSQVLRAIHPGGGFGQLDGNQETSYQNWEMNNSDLEDSLKKLTETLFAALVRVADSRSHIAFSKKYEEENQGIASQPLSRGKRDLMENFAQLKEDFYFDKVSEICDHLRYDRNEMVQLAKKCGETAQVIRRFNPVNSIWGKVQSNLADFMRMGQEFASNGRYLHSMFSYHVAARIHELLKKGNASVQGIDLCSNKMHFMAKRMAENNEMRCLVIDHVIPVMWKLKEYISSIGNANENVKVEKLGWCESRIALCYYYTGMFRKFGETIEQAIDDMKSTWKTDATKYQIYGRCLYNLGLANQKMGNISTAMEYCNMAMDAYQQATDWKDDNERARCSRLVDVLRKKGRIPPKTVTVC